MQSLFFFRVLPCLAAVSFCAGAQADIQLSGTKGVMRAVPTAGAVKIRRIGIYDDSRTGLGARLARHIQARLRRRGIRVDDAAALLLTIRPTIVGPNTGTSPTTPPLSIATSTSAFISATPIWSKDRNLGINRITSPSDQLDGARVSLHIRNALGRRPEGSSLYRIQLQIERDGQAPLWYGHAVAVGHSGNPERALARMADLLLRHLGRTRSPQPFKTR